MVMIFYSQLLWRAIAIAYFRVCFKYKERRYLRSLGES